MTQYLFDIKAKVKTIAIAGSPLDHEDIILCTLNGLPLTYQAFKIAIMTNLQSLHEVEFYSMLCSEELYLAAVVAREQTTQPTPDSQLALHIGNRRGHSKTSTFQNNKERSNSRFRSNALLNLATTGTTIPLQYVKFAINWPHNLQMLVPHRHHLSVEVSNSNLNSTKL